MVDEDLSSLKSPVRMPQTQFLNIFKSDNNSLEQTRSVLSNTIDKAQWTNSTLACTIQENTRNQGRFASQKMPFEMSPSISP
jgi:hypothetical protein